MKKIIIQLTKLKEMMLCIMILVSGHNAFAQLTYADTLQARLVAHPQNDTIKELLWLQKGQISG